MDATAVPGAGVAPPGFCQPRPAAVATGRAKPSGVAWAAEADPGADWTGEEDNAAHARTPVHNLPRAACWLKRHAAGASLSQP